MYIYGGNDIKEGQVKHLWKIDVSNLRNIDPIEFSTTDNPEWIKIDTLGINQP